MADAITIQALQDASLDAKSLSEFVFKPASFMVQRRLAPSINTLQYYLDLFENISIGGEFNSAKIESLTVNTGEAGTQASVATGGTPSNRTFALTIPRGDKGVDGKSAYQSALDNGFVGTEAEWKLYLKSDGSIQALQQFMTNPASTEVSVPDYGNIPSLQGYISTMFANGGLPATPFATKALMTASALVDGDYAMVTDDTVNNGLYVKAAGAWVKSAYDPVSNANQFSVDKIESLKDSLIVTSKNLFNASSATLDRFIGADGVIVSSTTYHISDFIPVDSGEYTMSAEVGAAESFRSANFYDKNKNFLRQSIYATGGSNPRTITISPDTYFVRFNMRLGAPQELKRMFNKGAVALPYEAYKKELRDVTFSNKQLVDIKDSLDIKDTAKPYFKNADSYNLYNYMNVVEGYGVNNTTGELEVDADYFITEFIPVKPSTKYGISNEIGVNGFNKTAYYDENKQFIKYINSLTKTDGFYAWTTPVNARFVRLASNYLYPSAYKRMFVEGDESKPYISGVPTLSGVKLSENIMKQINREVNVSSDITPYVFDRNIDELFGLSEGYSGFEDWGGRTAAEVYTLYDELADNNSDYITKHDMQLDLLGNEIAYYKLSPAKPLIGQESRLPVVVLNVGIHGHEKAATLSTYLFIKLLCEGWRDDPVLEAMRFGVVFYILPISNPSGWDANTRKNHNGVDLNRNFPYKWNNKLLPDNEKYGGASAASEVETQNIMAMLEDAGDIDIFYDHHNFQGSIDRYLWVSIGGADNRLLERMSQSFISRMTNKWRKEYDWIPQDESWFAGYSDTAASPSSGILGNYVRFEVGVLAAATFEVCDNWTVNRGLTKYGVELTKTSVEALVNWLAINLVSIHHYRG